MSTYVVQRDGRPATAEDLAPLAFSGYAHFTAMQVRGGGVRGLDLHVDRLRTASLAMYGTAIPDDRLCSYLRTALEAGPADLSLRATVYSRGSDFSVSGADPEVLIRTGPPVPEPEGPLALTAVEHERSLPTIKYVGEVAKTHYLRHAAEQGCDDAAFVDRRGRLTEATVWNLAFWDGVSVVWPEAEMLVGTAMEVVQRRLTRLGVPQRTAEIRLADLPELTGAVVLNSWTPGVAVHRIGSVSLPGAPGFLDLLHRAYEEEPFVAP